MKYLSTLLSAFGLFCITTSVYAIYYGNGSNHAQHLHTTALGNNNNHVKAMMNGMSGAEVAEVEMAEFTNSNNNAVAQHNGNGNGNEVATDTDQNGDMMYALAEDEVTVEEPGEKSMGWFARGRQRRQTRRAGRHERRAARKAAYHGVSPMEIDEFSDVEQPQ